MSINNPANPLKKAFTGNFDFSNVSSMKAHMISLLADGWDEENMQEVSIPDILEDVNKQLIIPIPAEDSDDVCKTFGIKPLNQSAGYLSFVAETTPDVDVEIVVFIFEAVSVEDNTPEENYVWWSPHMTSDTTPSPYKVEASSTYMNMSNYAPYKIFDNDETSIWGPQMGDTNPTITFSFGKTTRIKGVQMSPITSALEQFPVRFNVEVSDDKTTWTQVYTANLSDYPTTVTDFMFSESVTCTYIRFTNLNSNSSDGHPSVSEIQFYRPESEVTV